MLIKAVAGSKLYGTNTHESDDDFMGIFLSTPSQKLGTQYVEQIGSDDDVMYELAKYVKLAVNGNPTVLQLLWTPQSMWTQWDSRWEHLQPQLRQLVLSERCRAAFLGYLDGQRKKLISNRQQRPQLIEKYGYDTKFAMHMVRLAFQGIEVVSSGTMSLPCKERELLLDIRNGELLFESVMELTSELEDDLKHCPSCLPPSVDHTKLSAWMASTYKEFWGWTSTK